MMHFRPWPVPSGEFLRKIPNTFKFHLNKANSLAMYLNFNLNPLPERSVIQNLETWADMHRSSFLAFLIEFSSGPKMINPNFIG